MFALGGSSVILCSTDNGNSWKEISSIAENVTVSSLLAHNGQLYAGTLGSGVWKLPLSGLLASTPIPSQANFGLEQNRPNPSSNSTRIPFTITSHSFVSLTIFDQLGKVVTTLVSEELPPGDYTRELATSDLASGNYTYELRTSEGIQTKKLVIIK
jgi:hypothetical protein